MRIRHIDIVNGILAASLLSSSFSGFSNAAFAEQSTSKGPEAVARLEPTRVVAVVDEKPITAKQAMGILSHVSPQTRNEYQLRLPYLVQYLYMHSQVAAQATKLRLDHQEPWRTKLSTDYRVLTQGVTNYLGDPNVPPAVMAQWNSVREKILWNAYFSQGATKEEKDALLAREHERFKLKVVDADFFNGVTSVSK